MLNKIDFNNKIWDTSYNQKLVVLIKAFELTPSVESDTFEELTDLIWQDGVCEPVFFAAIPYLIEIAAGLRIEDSKDLWSYLGCWIATHEKYRHGVSEEVLKYFDVSLKYAEEACIQQIICVEKLDDTDAWYLYAGLFVFARHRLGYMTMSGYMGDFAGTSVAKCKKGHLNDVTVYHSGIVPYDEKEKPCKITMPEVTDIDIEVNKNNHWNLFGERIQQAIEHESTSDEIKAHLELSKNIIHKGVTSQLLMKYAFSLYGSLLYCNGSVEASMRAFHGWDEITCIECGKKFIFAEGWCEDQ